jgi:hypothetical protein
MRHRNLLVLTLILTGCAHGSVPRSEVYSTPERFVGQAVRVCGYMIDSSNILESDDRNERERNGGLSIREKGPLNLLHRGRVCVEGEVSYWGCATGPVICTDAAFDYAISITRVLEYF